MNLFSKVEQFNKKVIGIQRSDIINLDPSEKQWLVNALLEEVGEFIGADSIVGQVDALIDLIYFAMGGLTRLGIPADKACACFEAVHECNMRKRKGVKETRGHELDATKPDNWVSPELLIEKILNGEMK